MRRYRELPKYKEIEKRHCEKIYGTPMELAKRKVRIAIVAGMLPRASVFDCIDCGEPAKCYDHRDYRKPLDVEPVCVGCNKKRGSGYHG